MIKVELIKKNKEPEKKKEKEKEELQRKPYKISFQVLNGKLEQEKPKRKSENIYCMRFD